ncbi:MAG TPA: DUF6596 domain-containing protein, partial [Myxococcaceae bacterium]|nr:DUF6596 domain-containing protein [Myxococcaceae bacterium]
GLDATRIGSAFLVAPATMGQRLVRAKAKIRDARIPFELPERSELPERLGAVLEAIYAAYGTGWDDLAGTDARRRGLSEEAVWLARTVVQALPDAPEALGLLALLLHCEARREARRDPDGRFVPLDRQDVALWDAARIDEAEQLLDRAFRAGILGHFQLEAAIQSAHASRRRTGRVPWPEVARLYDALVRLAPGVGVSVARASAYAEASGPQHGLALLEPLAIAGENYQPYWAVRADLLRRIGRREEGLEAYRRALGLTEDPAVREFLSARLAEP